ncbi:TonB family protein [Fulvivirga sp. 29W222]|uniref:TonB family protein n=1 Tax=Fulvivirga marina TaxID=2494733 RepID=A0A937KCY5_9BACT|nr:energy transducer TonB [Fulvivirga marina]MBL6447904.1 TonB family protein [Fulvivirga marina]
MKLLITLLLLASVSGGALSQYTIYYNGKGKITLPELATHYRIANINVDGKHFVGNVVEYRMDSSLIMEINYDSSGLKQGAFRYVMRAEGAIDATFADNKLLGSDKLPDSLLLIISKKEEFAKGMYIRKNDYPGLKPLLIDNYDAEKAESTADEEKELFIIVEDPPKFPGGISRLYEMLGNYLVYPPEALEKKVTGKVFVQFVINPDGTTSEVTVVRGIGGGCDEAAQYAVSKMPDWSPGYQWGKPVPVRMILPITFN